MSLNRCEQRVFDYLQRHPDERHHWQGKFQAAAKAADSVHVAADRLAQELWRYYEERSAVVQPFKDAVLHEGLKRTSMKNLAELLLRLWTESKQKPLQKMAPSYRGPSQTGMISLTGIKVGL